MKSVKNKVEINNTIKSHISDGVAVTKFLYWIKKNQNKKISEIDAEKKLASFRKQNKNYLFPSFNTISATGKNGSIIHYRASKKTCKEIKLNDLYRDRVEKFSLRHETRPGVTGLSQMKGYRGSITQYHQINSRVKLDRFYIKKWTFLFDLKIILLTIPATIHWGLSSR